MLHEGTAGQKKPGRDIRSNSGRRRESERSQMIYNVYRLKTEYGEPGELMLRTGDRVECMRKVAEMIKEGESAATIRVITDYEPVEKKGREVWRYYY